MGRMKELRQILENLSGILEELVDFLSAYDEPEQLIEADPEPTPLSKEDVRKILAEWMSRDEGRYKPVVCDLLRKYSETGKLSGVNPEDYQGLLMELEAISNAAD